MRLLLSGQRISDNDNCNSNSQGNDAGDIVGNGSEIMGEQKERKNEEVQHRRYRSHRERPRIQLLLVPMIDVVFLLLTFFLLTASFRPAEAFLPAELPGGSAADVEVMELEPLLIFLESRPDGGCLVQIGNDVEFEVVDSSTKALTGQSAKAGRMRIEQLPEQVGFEHWPEQISFEQLPGKIELVLKQQHRSSDDPVKLIPQRQTNWDHVLKTYHALWRLNLTNIIFAIVE
ncbi:MAG: biopolymer transporter ExbD [Sedimentisphaerales bacterium]|nr:biopolymer transporter ExbD [Sedimentisphaerales bacterium]